MLNQLKLTNYRGFKQYSVNDLARVNLFVGKNGSGKTSILEAVQILIARGDIGFLNAITRRRAETPSDSSSDDMSDVSIIYRPNVRHFFYKRQIVPRAFFEISADNFETVRAEIDEPTTSDTEALSDITELPENRVIRVLRILEGRFLVEDDGTLLITDRKFFPNLLKLNPQEHRRTPTRFITSDSLRVQAMSSMWNEMVFDSMESEVIDVMRILDDSIEDIFFLKEDKAHRSETTILVSYKGGRGRVPLGSTGEGMRRLLAIALALVESKGGILLIDEIDTGLHYSVLGDMWRLIARAAKTSDIQVFATTHSLDCVRGLAWLCENYPDLAGDVALHKIDSSLERSIVLDGNQIVIASEQEIEVR